MKKASIELTDLGLLRGYGIFDYLRTYNGQPFLLDNHLERFEYSAKEMQLNLSVTSEDIKNIIKQLLIKNEVQEAGIRLVLTGGPSKDAFSIETPNFFILIEHLYNYPDTYLKNGIKLITHEHLRRFPTIKTTKYETAIRLQPLCKKEHAQEILYVYNGNMLECTRSNFFIFKNNTLITPLENVLIGRTRNFVIALAKDKFEVEERDIKINELTEVNEAFITGTTKKIMPVVTIDNKPIGTGKVGANTKTLIRLFEENIASYTNPVCGITTKKRTRS